MTAEQEMVFLQQQREVNAKENYNRTFYKEIPVLTGFVASKEPQKPIGETWGLKENKTKKGFYKKVDLTDLF